MLDPRELLSRMPAIQAPMCGCSDLVYRRVVRRFGCELAFAEMVKDRPVIADNARTREILATAPDDHPMGMQLAGRDPELLAEAARRLEAMGADVVDLNLGCPVPKVVKDGCGAALLKEPALVGRILERMAGAVRIPVTLKMRSGFDDGDDGRFLEIARLAESAGARAITVHGRTRTQFFKGNANFEAIRKVKSLVKIPVIGNGDIRRAEDALRMMRETGCDGVMVARGALGNPWLFAEIRAAWRGEPAPPPPTVQDRAAMLGEFFDGMRALYGDRQACLRIRRVIHWFVKGVEHSTDLRAAGNGITSVEKFGEFVGRFAELKMAPGGSGGNDQSNSKVECEMSASRMEIADGRPSTVARKSFDGYASFRAGVEPRPSCEVGL
jgi:nifR3 family TIM-barrel protein